MNANITKITYNGSAKSWVNKMNLRMQRRQIRRKNKTTIFTLAASHKIYMWMLSQFKED